MNKNHSFCCPRTSLPLDLDVFELDGDNVLEGNLISAGGDIYPIKNGIPNLTNPDSLPQSDQESKEWYDENASVYDEYLHYTFDTFGVNEVAERQSMVDLLKLRSDDKVLETGCGTGRDSLLIASKLGKKGELHLQDISINILTYSFEKLSQSSPKITYSISNAIYLPYPDNYFDAYYHFGGFNTFSDKKRGFSEIARVVKPEGRIIVGDESMPPWLRNSEFGKILMNSNPHYVHEIPLSYMHFTARNVKVEFIIGGVFYYIFYINGEGYPKADFDFEIPGRRGGTHRTRYYGILEGVTPDAINLAQRASEISGKSMHKWLDDTVKQRAMKDLSGNSRSENDSDV